MMTPVEFYFVTPEGVPISDAEVEIQLLRSAFDIEDSGVLMPRPVVVTTDEDGKVIVELWSTTTMYQVRVYDSVSDAGLFYKFYVPEMDVPGTIVRFQDIVVDVEMENTSFADAALVQVQTARVNAVAAQQAAQASATQAAASAQGVSTFATSAAASATAAAGSATTASTAATTATTKAAEASATATSITGSVTTATTKASEASASASAALTSQNAAATSATGAVTSATTATIKAGEAATSATSAAGSATTASNQATIATTKASEASTSASNAAGSASAAAGSATTASTGASTATTQATAAGTSATAAQTSATNAASSATSATASRDAAAVSATTASTKASEASASATSAQTSATTATTQAGIATTKAAEAVTSATNAAGSATAASGLASTASTQASNAAASATAAQTSATNAAASQTSVATNAAIATTQAGIATTKASEAAASASTASTGATTATTKANEASASASSALAAKVAAETVRDQTLAAFDSFDDRYLGPKTIDPTADNDGNALVGGSLYFNTNPVESGGGMKVYDGSVWRSAYASLSGALIASNNLSDLASASAARINLGLGNVENKSSATIRGELSSSNVTTALGFTPYDAANPSSYITAAALSSYLTSATAASTYQPLLGYTAANKAGDTFTGAVLTSNAGGFTANSAAKLWTDSNRGRLDLYEGAAQTKSLRVFNANGYGIVGMTSAENLELWTNGVPRLTLGGTGDITASTNIVVANGTDSRVNLQVSGVTEGILTASATNVRLSSANAIPMTFGTNGVTRLTLTGTGYITTGVSEYVGIGAQANTNNSLRIARNIENGTSAYAVLNDGTFQSGVTVNGAGFRSVARTAAAAFTMASLHHYQAVQATLGAGSAITTQAGFVVDSSLIGATNNYGFQGSIAAATGRWNAYMDGTAQNWFAGNVGIGAGKSVPATALDVNGTVTATSFAGSAAGLTGLKTVNGNNIIGSGDIVIAGGVTSFNTRTGAVTLSSGDVTTALGFTPYNSTNPSGYITSSGSITGSAATLTTPRVLSIGNTGKTFNGSAGVSWSLSEIGAASTATNFFTGSQTGNDNLLFRWNLADYGYVYFNSGVTNTLNFSNGSHQRWTPNTGAQTLSITNWPPSGNLGELLIEGVNLGAATITFPTINWVTSTGATTTTFSSAGVTLQTSGVDWILLWTRDAGTTIYGKVVR